jgi:signal transduction histidine kinase
LPVPYVAAGSHGRRTLQTAAFTVSHSPKALEALRSSVDRWFLGVLVLSASAALVGAAWLAERTSRPLRALADRTARMDFERLDMEFPAGRDDEIGALARLMNAMMRRLRASVSRVRDAERRAAMGDLARQVNHDVKNGLAPIRHVLRHLTQVEQEHPEQLAAVFAERRATLEASVAYLDTLARNYARLTPRLDVVPCDANAVARGVAAGAALPPNTIVALDLDEHLPVVPADALVLRRILTNLVSNATDALDGRSGGVTISSARVADGGVRVTVTDTGRGMTREQLDRAFDDFYTTKAGGTGLGLSIVRRLVTDLHGVLRVDTQPGAGTTVTITFPADPLSPNGMT